MNDEFVYYDNLNASQPHHHYHDHHQRQHQHANIQINYNNAIYNNNNNKQSETTHSHNNNNNNGIIQNNSSYQSVDNGWHRDIEPNLKVVAGEIYKRVDCMAAVGVDSGASSSSSLHNLSASRDTITNSMSNNQQSTASNNATSNSSSSGSICGDGGGQAVCAASNDYILKAINKRKLHLSCPLCSSIVLNMSDHLLKKHSLRDRGERKNVMDQVRKTTCSSSSSSPPSISTSTSTSSSSSSSQLLSCLNGHHHRHHHEHCRQLNAHAVVSHPAAPSSSSQGAVARELRNRRLIKCPMCTSEHKYFVNITDHLIKIHGLIECERRKPVLKLIREQSLIYTFRSTASSPSSADVTMSLTSSQVGKHHHHHHHSMHVDACGGGIRRRQHQQQHQQQLATASNSTRKYVNKRGGVVEMEDDAWMAIVGDQDDQAMQHGLQQESFEITSIKITSVILIRQKYLKIETTFE